MLTHFFLVVFALHSIAIYVASSQTPQRFERLSLEQGLPQSSVLALLQDHIGFIWFGTQEGLARYDGYGFKVFRKSFTTAHSLKGHWVQALHEDRFGNLWIGTMDGGLQQFNPLTQRFSSFPYKSPENPKAILTVRYIHEDADSTTLWLATNSAGLLTFDTKRLSFTALYRADSNNAKSLSGNSVRGFFSDSHGTLWIATNNGLCKRNPKTKDFTRVRCLDWASKRTIPNFTSLCEIARDVLLLGTASGEILQFDCHTEQFTPFYGANKLAPYLAGSVITGIAVDRQGTVWFATANKGLILFDKQHRITQYHSTSYDTQSLSSNHLRSLYQDRSGIMWVGTNDAGVNKFDPKAQSFALYRHNDALSKSLSANNISTMHADHTGLIWIGTEEGLNVLNPQTNAFSVYRHGNPRRRNINGNAIIGIAEDSLGALWVSTTVGLNRLNRATGEFTSLLSDNKQWKGNVLSSWVGALYVDRRGALWVQGERAAYQRIDTKTFTVSPYHHANILGRRPPRVLLEDQHGAWWIGSFGAGLVRYNSSLEKYECFTTDSNRTNSIAADIVYTLYEDSRGWLWVGTANGLDVFDRTSKSFEHIFEKDKLPGGDINAILEDNNGRIWFSDNHGLVAVTILSGKPAEAHGSTKALQYSTQRFDIGDGLQSNEFNQGAACRGLDGRFYFGGVNGISAFHPDSILRNMVPPPVAITDFKLSNESRRTLDTMPSANSHITLSHHENSFTITFAALDFANPQKNLYAYMLEGFDQNWIYSDAKERTARYTNLDGGTYIFRVKAANNHGVWNTEGAAIVIIIEPPFWRTVWFYALVLFTFGGIVWSIAQRKLRMALMRAEELEKIREQESNAIRKKTANDFHDEFGHKLSRIAFLSEVMKQATSVAGGETSPNEVHEQQLSSLNKIIDTATDLSVGLRDFLWALNPENDSLYQIGIRLKDFGEEIFEATDIAFHVLGVSEELEDIHFSMDERRHITLLFKEAMTLIARNGKCATVTFEILFEFGRTNIFLCDDSVHIGSDTSSDVSQNRSLNDYNLRRGLFSLNERAERAHGKLNIIFRQGQGTTIHFCKE
ncbi:MAG: hypothetical protein H9535_07875 [Ignavibacteria bacterium]|nr:hypothetical protein [Ignavibacteria bacterium]